MAIANMSKQSSLIDLADRIQSAVQQLQTHLTTTLQSDPNLLNTTSVVDWTDADDTRCAVLEDILELQELLMTPKEVLLKETVSTDFRVAVVDEKVDNEVDRRLACYHITSLQLTR
jgi:hypothetical protein